MERRTASKGLRWEQSYEEGLYKMLARRLFNPHHRCHRLLPIHELSRLSSELHHDPLEPIPEKPRHSHCLGCVQVNLEVDQQVGRRHVLDANPTKSLQFFEIVAKLIGPFLVGLAFRDRDERAVEIEPELAVMRHGPSWYSQNSSLAPWNKPRAFASATGKHAQRINQTALQAIPGALLAILAIPE